MSHAPTAPDRTTTWRDILPVHPAADLFPLLPPDELAALAADIKANGLRETPIIWRDPAGTWQLLDGRNRLDALASLRDDPLYRYPTLGYQVVTGSTTPNTRALRQYHGKDPAAYIVSANIRRRHLTPAERANLAARVLRAGETAQDAKPVSKPAPETVVIVWPDGKAQERDVLARAVVPETAGHPTVSKGGRGRVGLASKVAQAAGVSKDTAREQIAVAADPVLQPQVVAGTLTAAEAGRKVREAKVQTLAVEPNYNLLTGEPVQPRERPAQLWLIPWNEMVEAARKLNKLFDNGWPLQADLTKAQWKAMGPEIHRFGNFLFRFQQVVRKALEEIDGTNI